MRKNGSKGNYLCTTCRHQAAFDPAAPARAARYAQVEKLLLGRVWQRATVRLTGVARMTVAERAKKAGTRSVSREQNASVGSAGRAVDVCEL